MRQLTSIVALNPDGAIGVGNALPWRVRSDLRFFREQTLGQVVIMGRRTFDSLGRKGLPGRRNVVVTHGFSMNVDATDCWMAHSIEEAIVQADRLATSRREVFVVGGASMYEQFVPYVDRYLITEVSKEVPDADTFFSANHIADQSSWSVAKLGEGKADGSDDEADFKIFEFVAKDRLKISMRRDEAVLGASRRRSGNRLADISAELRAAG